MISDLNVFALQARAPQGAPWPQSLDAALWLWRSAPNLWRDQYDTGNDYSALMSNPAVWGLTGASHTSPPGAPTTATPGWTMGEGGRYDLRFEVQASFGYRLWKATLTPLDWARTILDRTAARFDPLQAPETELPRLADWADADWAALAGLSPAQQRRVIACSRALESQRGTDLSGPVLSRMLGSPVALSWGGPHLRIVATYAQITPGVRRFLRRCLPPHVNGQLRAFSGVADYTGGAYTAAYSGPGGVPEAAIHSVTASLIETTEPF